MNKIVGNSRGIKLIKAVYPEKENDPLQNHQLDALMKYLIINQGKLEEVAKYIEKRVKKDSSKGKFGYVRISMEVFKAIIKQTHSNTLTFYGSSVVNSMQLLLSLEKNSKNTADKTQIEEMKILATETFEEFAKARYNNNITEYRDLGFFVLNFIDMCNYESNAENKKRIRYFGFKGLHTFITTVDDLDAFVSKFIDAKDYNDTPKKEEENALTVNKKIVPTILHNILEYKQEKETDTENVRALATSCLSDLSRSVSAITNQSLLSALLNFLDKNGLWPQEEFAFECIKSISLKPQHNQVTTVELIKHVTVVTENNKIHIVNVLASFFERIARGSIGPIIEILLPLVKELVNSTMNTGDSNEGLPYQTAIVKCVGTLGKRMNDASERLEAISYFIEKLNGHEKHPQTTSVLLQCVLEILQHTKEFSKSLPSKVLDPLLELSLKGEPEIRITVAKVITALLSVNKRASVSLTSSMHVVEDKRMEKFLAALHESLLKQAMLYDNLPANYVAIYDLLAALFAVYRGQELEHSIPLIFKIEQIVIKEKSVPAHLGRSMHSVAAAYLLLVANSYSNQQLQDYVNEVMGQEWSPVLTLQDGKLSARKERFKKKHKKQGNVEMEIDKEKVVSILSKIQLLVQELGNRDLKQLFSMEMQTNDGTQAAPAIPKIEISSFLVQMNATPIPGGEVQSIGANMFKELFDDEDDEVEKKKSKAEKEEKAPLPKNIPYSELYKLSTTKSKVRRQVLHELTDVFIQEVTHSSSSTLAINYPALTHATLI